MGIAFVSYATDVLLDHVFNSDMMVCHGWLRLDCPSCQVVKPLPSAMKVQLESVLGRERFK